MLKESILFVASTGLLIYFIAPADKAPEAEQVAAPVREPAKPATQTSDDGWGYDDEEEETEDESFVFGEPMTLLDDQNNEKSSDEDGGANRQEQADNSGSASTAAPKVATRPSPNSPRPGALGSLENPIVFKTDNPVNAIDD